MSGMKRFAEELATPPARKGSFGTVEFPSRSSDKVYVTRLYATGATSCDCPGWLYQRKPLDARMCRHTRTVLESA